MFLANICTRNIKQEAFFVNSQKPKQRVHVVVSKKESQRFRFMPSPNEASTLATLLIQKCTSTATLRKARQLHALILTSTPPIHQSPYLNNNIVSMYSRCGSLVDSQLVFDRMPQRTIVSYNALITAYSWSSNQTHLAFELLARLDVEGFRPTGSTFTSLLQATSCLKDWVLGSMLHALGVKFGFLNDVIVETSILGMYSNCGDVESSVKVFDDIGDKDVMAWNSIIIGFMKNEMIGKGLYLFGSMVKSGAIPTQFTYSMVFNACSRLGDCGIGQLALARVIVSGMPADLPLQNALLDMYCSCGDIGEAVRVFSAIEHPDLVSWNSMLAGISENGDGEMVMDMFSHLCRSSFARPDEYTFATVIAATGSLPAFSCGEPLHAQVIKAGCERSGYVGSSLVSMYFNNGESESAQKIFISVSPKDIVLWTEMITGHTRMGDGENAIMCFHGMSQEGHKIDSFALSSALSACADLAGRTQGEMIHSQAVKRGYSLEMTVCGSLIDMYAKTGYLAAAEFILSQVDSPDLKCWNSMLGGYGHHGKAEAAFRIFDEIIKQGMRPDRVTFISVLAACSHCGLVSKGKFFWNNMKETGLSPGPKHYSCMIGLLSRAGLLGEAEEMIIESPPGEYQLELWRTLLSSCVSSRNLELGMRAAEQVLSIDPKDGATNVLLTNLYAATGKWDGVAEMRRKMRGLMTERDPGLSWIEVTKNTHVFSAGDQSHPEADEMQVELHRLQGNLVKQEIDQM